jgi:ABC-type Fe3+/spermidine/putrescine transport system ATPase subunit
VALARGLVLEPSVLLLDEPLSNLDADLRHQMRELICTIQQQTGTTMLFVTHDQSEALKISDRIGLLQEGILQQLGSPEELFYRPTTPEVATFFGSSNFISGHISNGIFRTTSVRLTASLKDSSTVHAVIRPEDINLTTSPSPESLKGKVLHIRFEGTSTRISVQVEESTFTVLAVRPELTVGQTVWLRFPAERLHMFPDD